MKANNDKCNAASSEKKTLNDSFLFTTTTTECCCNVRRVDATIDSRMQNAKGEIFVNIRTRDAVGDNEHIINLPYTANHS